MVTKHERINLSLEECYILAKNHMVTKLTFTVTVPSSGYILAKNHMVTKPVAANSIDASALYSSKKPYGNKTVSTVFCF